MVSTNPARAREGAAAGPGIYPASVWTYQLLNWSDSRMPDLGMMMRQWFLECFGVCKKKCRRRSGMPYKIVVS